MGRWGEPLFLEEGLVLLGGFPIARTGGPDANEGVGCP